MRAMDSPCSQRVLRSAPCKPPADLDLSQDLREAMSWPTNWDPGPGGHQARRRPPSEDGTDLDGPHEQPSASGHGWMTSSKTARPSLGRSAVAVGILVCLVIAGLTVAWLTEPALGWRLGYLPDRLYFDARFAQEVTVLPIKVPWFDCDTETRHGSMRAYVMPGSGLATSRDHLHPGLGDRHAAGGPCLLRHGVCIGRGQARVRPPGPGAAPGATR